ncbi:MAG: hypothetical protein ABIO43_12080 [Sphingomicrobium sp.]
MILALRWRQCEPAIVTRWRPQRRAAAMPPRPAETALAVLIGPPGQDSLDAMELVLEAAEAIGGHRVCYVGSDDLARLADPSTAAALRPAGVSLGAAMAGASVQIQGGGMIRELGWSWAPGPVYLAAGGTLSQTPPMSGAIYQVGVSAGPQRMRIIPLLIAQLN